MTVILIIIAVVLFGLIIFVHEFGHFFTAKLSGIKVNEFSMGMGPKLLSFKKKETQYSLRLLPIGGYCAMEGEDAESEDSGSFGSKPIYKRMIVIVAGSIMNLLFGLVLMLIVVSQQNLIATNQIAQFGEDSKMEQAGLQVGDEITAINGYAVNTDRDLFFAFALAKPEAVDIEYSRNGEKYLIEDAVLGAQEVDGRTYIAVDFYVLGEEKTVLGVLQKTFDDSVSVVRMVIESLRMLVTGQFNLNDVSGPVGMAQAVSEVAATSSEYGFVAGLNNILVMMVVISINLGIFNLIPFPALDGGRFVFLLIEAVRRKPVPVKYESYVNIVGFVILIGFMLVVTFSDIFKLVM